MYLYVHVQVHTNTSEIELWIVTDEIFAVKPLTSMKKPTLDEQRLQVCSTHQQHSNTASKLKLWDQASPQEP